jgi:low molecular weight protein-tyrosine phosphatase
VSALFAQVQRADTEARPYSSLMSQRVLFLCTGNYYRSRFAEILFNHLAGRAAPGWSAFSRALAMELGTRNEGPISAHTRKACTDRGIAVEEPVRSPMSATDEDFNSAARVIALKEAEHRAYMCQRFPHWADRIEYWHVHDLDAAEPGDACAEIERLVRGLVRELGERRVR